MFDCNAYTGMHMLKTSDEKTMMEIFLNADTINPQWM